MRAAAARDCVDERVHSRSPPQDARPSVAAEFEAEQPRGRGAGRARQPFVRAAFDVMVTGARWSARNEVRTNDLAADTVTSHDPARRVAAQNVNGPARPRAKPLPRP